MIEEEKFNLEILKRVIYKEILAGKVEVTESELKRILCGEKCPFCGKWSLGYIEADEHKMLHDDLKNYQRMLKKVVDILEKGIKSKYVLIESGTVSLSDVQFELGALSGMQEAKELVRKNVEKDGKEWSEGTLVL